MASCPIGFSEEEAQSSFLNRANATVMPGSSRKHQMSTEHGKLWLSIHIFTYVIDETAENDLPTTSASNSGPNVQKKPKKGVFLLVIKDSTRPIFGCIDRFRPNLLVRSSPRPTRSRNGSYGRSGKGISSCATNGNLLIIGIYQCYIID